MNIVVRYQEGARCSLPKVPKSQLPMISLPDKGRVNHRSMKHAYEYEAFHLSNGLMGKGGPHVRSY